MIYTSPIISIKSVLGVKPLKRKILVIILIILAFPAYGAYWAFFDMSRLPKGDLLTEVYSPDGFYSIKAYLTDGGATTSYAIRGELNFHNNNKNPRNIYWNYRQNEATIEWIDKNTVVINGHELDVPNEKFDYRQHL